MNTDINNKTYYTTGLILNDKPRGFMKRIGTNLRTHHRGSAGFCSLLEG